MQYGTGGRRMKTIQLTLFGDEVEVIFEQRKCGCRLTYIESRGQAWEICGNDDLHDINKPWTFR